MFLSIWISFHPFQSLAEPPLALAEGGDRLNQIGFSTLFLVLAAWTYFHEPGRLMLLVRPVMIAMLVWCAASIVTSWEPSLAARRLAFTLVVMSIIDADIERRTLSAIDADQNEAGLVDVAIGHRELSDVIIRDRETNINLMSFVSPNSRRDRRISDANVKQAFDQTKRFDMVIVAAIDLSRDPSARFFAGLVNHIVLVARADEQSKGALEQFMSRLGLDARKVRGAVLTGERVA